VPPGVISGPVHGLAHDVAAGVRHQNGDRIVVERFPRGYGTAVVPTSSRTQRRAGVLPALLLGTGLGGFVDGIVLHQILQWHHMVSHTPGNAPNSLSGLQVNTRADGYFHSAAWLCVAAGTLWMFADRHGGKPGMSPRSLVGLMLVGWGAFNIAEGVIDHHILGLHHVRDDLGGPLAWDLGFLVVSAVLAVAGWLLHRSSLARDHGSA
jgi:uncharacterized membrane protein